MESGSGLSLAKTNDVAGAQWGTNDSNAVELGAMMALTEIAEIRDVVFHDNFAMLTRNQYILFV